MVEDRHEPTAGIVLAGGRSRRMGADKATLEWHGSTLVRRAVGLVGRAVEGPVVVVRGAGQALPNLPARVETTDDERADRGPLQGIAAGLAQIAGRASVVYVSGVDAPLLHPALIAHVVRALRPEDDVALPHVDGFPQPLAAAYRTAIAPRLQALLADDELPMRTLLAGLRVRELDRDHLLGDARLALHDPELDSLRSLNDPADYEAARARPAPRVTVRAPADPEPREVRAATLAAAAAAAGITLSARLAVTLAGHGPIEDPDEPLGDGDAIIFELAATRPTAPSPW